MRFALRAASLFSQGEGEAVMRQQRTVALGVLVVFLASGCALRDRKWGMCAVGGGVVGAAVGGVTGGVAVNNGKNHPDNATRGGAIGGGIVGGALIGALLGHVICDPEVAAPPPPPAPAPPPPAKAEPLVTLHGPQFDFNKATLKPDGKRMVDQGVTVLKDKPAMNVSVEGHTDSIGSDAYNQKLSLRRAGTVRDYLVSQGIDSGRIAVKGWGKTKPVADNKTEAGRAENRRVEIIPE
jgi:OOP family OmpA-OmpF porin